MRAITLAGFMTLASATVASAQSDSDYAGTWAFQTAPYGSGAVGAYMSGLAVMTPSAPDRYEIRLMANERLVNRPTGETRLLVAHQTCTGEQTGAQFSITCEMAEPLEGYQADNFILQPGEEAGQLVGVLDSLNHAQVTFTRMR